VQAYTHFLVKFYSIEPVVDNYYTFFQEKMVSEGQTIYFTSNKDLNMLTYTPWYPNMDQKKFKQIGGESNRAITFQYEGWIFPGAGFAIVWQN
jgi:hypothetical protein